MQTVQIVAIVAATTGLLALAYLLRTRLTRLVVKFGRASAEVEADPNTKGPAGSGLTGKGVVLDESKVSGSGVKVTDSTLVARQSKVKDSSIEVSERASAEPNG